MLEHLRQVVHYRELVLNLVIRDLKVRYRNSILGFLWTWGNPILMTVVLTTAFKVLLNSSVQRFELFILVGWLTWSFTTTSVIDGIGSVISNGNLVKKIYFPREVLPVSAILANATNFLLAIPLILLVIMLDRVSVDPTLLLYFPIVFAAQLALVLGLGFFLSALNVFYRDTGVIVSALLTAWFFLTPVFYPVKELLGRTWNGIDLARVMYFLNPMASIIESYRSIFYGSPAGGPPGPPDLAFLSRTLASALIVMLVGYLVFLRLSRRFGEEL